MTIDSIFAPMPAGGDSRGPQQRFTPGFRASALALTAIALGVSNALMAEETLDAVGRGSVNGNNDIHASSYDERGGTEAPYDVGLNYSPTSGERVIGPRRSFLVFDLPEAPEGQFVASAKLILFSNKLTPGTVDVHDVDAQIRELEAASARYSDLGDGPLLGSRDYDPDTDGGGVFTEIELNAEGVDAINRTLGRPYALSLRSALEDFGNTALVRSIFADSNDALRDYLGGDYPDYTWPASADFTQLVITWSGPGEPGSIGGTVFDDLNQNGVQDAGEPGVPGVAVAVIDANDATQATTMTDADGHYRFDNLAAGIQYRVAFERPSGFLFAQPLSPPFTTAWNGYTNEGVHWESGKFPYISTTGDFNGDGNQDVFSLHVVGRGFSGPISGSVVDGYGDGRFSLPHFVILSEDQTPISVATGDFDGDGRDDVVVGTAGSSNDRVSLFLSSEFDQDSPNPAHVVTVGEDPRILRVADLDDDGAPEIVVANLRDQTVSVLRYDGLSLTRSVDIGIPGLAAIALGDTNGDGVPDLLAATNTTPYAALEVSVLFGDGAGGFSTPPVTTVGPLASVWDPNTNEIFAESMEVGDVNNDGVLDAVFGTFGGIGISNPTDDPRNLVVAALGDGTGSFAFIGPSDLADFAFGEQDQTHQISVAELNGDGLLDVVSGSGRVYFGDGQGGFDYANNLEDGRPSSSLFILPGNAYQRRPAVADFNGDGNLDLVAPTTAPSALVGDDPDDQVQLLVYLNHNTGPLSGAITLGPGEIIDTQDKGLFRLMNFEKLVNGDPADDPSNPLPLTVGATVAYSFTIENTASFDLGTTDHPFTLVDDYATPGDDSDDLFFSVSGPGTMLTKGLTLTGGDDNSDGLLNQGETWVIGAADQVAIGGELTNTGRVYIGQTEIAVDTASYVGQSSETVAVIDWKPGSNPSAIKVSDKGSTPVAILGSAVFDVTGIDIASITANDEVSADGATVRRRGRGYQASFEDFNGDGYLDLILHFETADLRDVLINDAGGEDAFLGDDMLYIFGRNADEPFEGTQQVHDPLKLIDG